MSDVLPKRFFNVPAAVRRARRRGAAKPVACVLCVRHVKRQEWRRTGEDPLHLSHPAHPHQRHKFDIYEAGPADDPIRFTASELSNGVRGFYVSA